MSFHVYPVTPTEDQCTDYRVFINGTEAETNTARVSAMPFNRRWPGHQRQIEQTELVQFLSFAMDEPVKIKVIPPEKSPKVEIRPLKYGIIPTVNEDGSIEFTLDRPRKISVEPFGRNRAFHIFADAYKAYDIDPSDENVLYFGKGEHDVGLIEMKSNQTLFIDEGAVVYATVSAFNVHDIRILGKGILDNRKNKEKILFELNAVGNEMDVGNAERAYPVEIDHCDHVEVDGITLRDPLVYNLNFCSCRDVTVNNFKAIGDWRFNSDGVHFVNCIGGRLTDSFIRTYDDCICVRGYTTEEKERLLGVDYLDECRDIVISNNVIWNDWGVGFRIGAATLGREIYHVEFSDNIFMRITGSALDCINCDYADVHDFAYLRNTVELDEVMPISHIQTSDADKYEDHPFDADFCPTIIAMEIIQHMEYSNVKSNPEGIVGKLHDLTFDGLEICGRQLCRLKFAGFDDGHPAEHIFLKNITQNGKPLTAENLVLNAFCRDITI